MRSPSPAVRCDPARRPPCRRSATRAGRLACGHLSAMLGVDSLLPRRRAGGAVHTFGSGCRSLPAAAGRADNGGAFAVGGPISRRGVRDGHERDGAGRPGPIAGGRLLVRPPRRSGPRDGRPVPPLPLYSVCFCIQSRYWRIRRCSESPAPPLCRPCQKSSDAITICRSLSAPPPS